MRTRIKKDLDRGEGTRLAPGARLFDPNDDSHVAQSSPLMLKKKELQAAGGDETYRTQAAATNKQREKFASRRRADKETRPL